MSSSGNPNYEDPNFPHPKYENAQINAHMENLKKREQAQALSDATGEGTEGVGSKGERMKEQQQKEAAAKAGKK